MAAKDCLGPQCDNFKGVGGLFAGTQQDLFGGEGTPVFEDNKYSPSFGPPSPVKQEADAGTKVTHTYEHTSHPRVGLLGNTVTHEVGKLYHGGGGEIIGEMIKPGENNLYGRGAYAAAGTNDIRSLVGPYSYAMEKAQEQGRLFGSIREVTPVSSAEVVSDPDLKGQEYNPKMAENLSDVWVKDKVGLRPGREVAFPINEEVLRLSKMGRQIEAAKDEDLDIGPSVV